MGTIATLMSTQCKLVSPPTSCPESCVAPIQERWFQSQKMRDILAHYVWTEFVSSKLECRVVTILIVHARTLVKPHASNPTLTLFCMTSLLTRRNCCRLSSFKRLFSSISIVLRALLGIQCRIHMATRSTTSPVNRETNRFYRAMLSYSRWVNSSTTTLASKPL